MFVWNMYTLFMYECMPTPISWGIDDAREGQPPGALSFGAKPAPAGADSTCLKPGLCGNASWQVIQFHSSLLLGTVFFDSCVHGTHDTLPREARTIGRRLVNTPTRRTYQHLSCKSLSERSVELRCATGPRTASSTLLRFRPWQPIPQMTKCSLLFATPAADAHRPQYLLPCLRGMYPPAQASDPE